MAIVRKAIRRGLLKRPNKCSMCGKESRTHGHHNDYNSPLDVLWLCASCHKKIHLSKDSKYTKFKPVDDRSKMKRKYINVPCNGCSKNTRIEFKNYEEDNEYYCYDCSYTVKDRMKKYKIDWYLKHGR